MRRALFRAWLNARAAPLLAYLARIEESQWLSREEVDRLQVGKLRAILEYAGRNVPYYRDLFHKQGFEPASVRSVEDLTRLPVLERETLLTHFDDLCAVPRPPDAYARSTGGSTGRPLRFLVDRHEMATRSAHIYRGFRWLGWDLGDRAAYVWGSDIDAREHRGAMGRVRDAFVGVLWLDAFKMAGDRLDAHLDRIRRFDPAALIGYPSSLHLLARRALTTERPLKLRGVESSAEMLAPGVRRDLQLAFGCPVLDRYGCREAGVVAHECPAGSLHVNSEAVVLESAGGEVLLTTLNNHAMPLIRYRNEDLADLSAASCACGRGLPLVKGLRGRVSDIIRSPGGRLIHGEFFTHLFYDVPGVIRFQVAQTTLDRLEIRVVATADFGPDRRRAMEDAILKNADGGFRIVWRDVEEIPSGPSGKFRFTLSEITDTPADR
ncbi:MAG TPA: hypothetical protein VGK94_09820 [Candidatus Polarisedimenticolia bacterium]|jgi:phenylacetate-CoA ligase